jgi:hypothetical protein
VACGTGSQTTQHGNDNPASRQLGLFTRRNPPATSRQAFREVTVSGERGRAKRELVSWLRSQDQLLTSFEIARATGGDRHAVARRLPDCEKDGTVRRGPSRKCSVTGRPSITWGATVDANG